jgi:hypothetical protein
MGLRKVTTVWDGTYTDTWNQKNMSGYGLDRTYEGNTVTYTYHLREYQGSSEYSSTDRILRSSSTCIGRTHFNGTVYRGKEAVAKWDCKSNFSLQSFVS